MFISMYLAVLGLFVLAVVRVSIVRILPGLQLDSKSDQTDALPQSSQPSAINPWPYTLEMDICRTRILLVPRPESHLC
jgi:hypothetical protein